jgi:hypothetical protein
MRRSLIPLAAAIALCTSLAAQAGPPDCLPKPFGDGTAAHAYDDGTNYMVGWYCNNGYEWTMSYAFASHGWMTSDRLAELAAISTADDFRKYWDGHVTEVLSKKQYDDLLKHVPAAPSNPQWVMADRRMFPIVGGHRTILPAAIGSVGDPCTCSPATNRRTEGSSTYCLTRRAAPNGFDLYSLCKPAS